MPPYHKGRVNFTRAEESFSQLQCGLTENLPSMPVEALVTEATAGSSQDLPAGGQCKATPVHSSTSRDEASGCIQYVLHLVSYHQ